MKPTIRRGLTLIGTTVGVLALSTGTAMAHYCYRTDVPLNSKMSNGTAWNTKAATLAEFANADFLPPDCKEVMLEHIAGLPDNTLFMGPGLLAGGAVQGGKAPQGVGHLFEDARAFPECAELFQE